MNDLAEAVRRIAHDKPQAAEQFGLKLIAEAESLREMPHRGRWVPERAERDCREIILKPYRIIYRIREELQTIEIIRFWHAARGTPVVGSNKN